MQGALVKEHQRSGRGSATAKLLLERFAFIVLIFAALGFMLIERIDPKSIEIVRVQVTDAVAPIIDVLSRPVDTIGEGIDEVQAILNVNEENKLLSIERSRLLHWRQVARDLEAQNISLRKLLNFVPSKPAKFISARIIGDAGGAFAHTLLVNAGEKHGVRKGQAVVTGEGLLGQVQEVGGLSARILLITDLNSRIPVILELSRISGIMIGNNELRPRLIHMPPGAVVSPGDRIVTSGHAGAFPPGLPIGHILSVGDSGVQVQTYIDPGRVEYVRIFDFGMAGILPSPKKFRSDSIAKKNKTK